MRYVFSDEILMKPHWMKNKCISFFFFLLMFFVYFVMHLAVNNLQSVYLKYSDKIANVKQRGSIETVPDSSAFQGLSGQTCIVRIKKKKIARII